MPFASWDASFARKSRLFLTLEFNLAAAHPWQQSPCMRKTEADRTRLTPDELATIGQYLFGARWRPPLARALNVSPRAVHFWASGHEPIPNRRAAQIAAVPAQRAEQQIKLVRSAYCALLDQITNAEAFQVI
jgi:hypothetical protein